MKIAVVAAGVPNPTSGGGALTCWSIIRALLDRKHTVGVCVIDDLTASASSQTQGEMLTQLSDLNVSILRVASQTPGLRSMSGLAKAAVALSDPFYFSYPTARLAREVEQHLGRLSPDAIFIYHFDALASACRVSVAPKMVGVGDPSHLPDYHRWRLTRPAIGPTYLLRTVSMLFRRALQPRMMRTMMNFCESAGAFAAHHAEWYREAGVGHCNYLRTPVPDNVGSDWIKRRRESSDDGAFKVVLIGHLRGIATISGLQLFAREVLPILESELGPGRFQVHIVGGHQPPAYLEHLLDRPSVIMRGHVEPADEEFLSAHVVVVPTPIPLGIRVRILSAWSFGSCVVCHTANAKGIPEIADGENALLASTGEEMAAQILRALRDAELRSRLQLGGRRTFERSFTIQEAGGRIVDELERISGKNGPAA